MEEKKPSEIFGVPSPEVADALAENVVPLGYEEGKRLHEQMGNDMMSYLTAEVGMFMAREGFDMKSKEGKAVTDFVAYVVTQWNGTRE